MRSTVFLVGHAQLPQAAAAKQTFDTLAVTAEADVRYGVIVRVNCTLATAHASDYISSLLVGYSLLDNLEQPIEEIRRHYQGVTQNAVVAALRDLQRDFSEWRARHGAPGAAAREVGARPEPPERNLEIAVSNVKSTRR